MNRIFSRSVITFGLVILAAVIIAGMNIDARAATSVPYIFPGGLDGTTRWGQVNDDFSALAQAIDLRPPNPNMIGGIVNADGTIISAGTGTGFTITHEQGTGIYILSIIATALTGSNIPTCTTSAYSSGPNAVWVQCGPGPQTIFGSSGSLPAVQTISTYTGAPTTPMDAAFSFICIQ